MDYFTSNRASGSIYSKEKKKSEKILNINLMSSPRIKLKTGDKVKVITGKYRGTIDFVSRLDPKKQMVYLKKVSRKKYDKSTPESKKKSELKEIMTPVYISNVAYWLEDKKQITKIGFREKEGQKKRVARNFKDKKGNNLLID
ncbi:MAG: 50S ribosomal protein L24 [Mycoplasmataceae bacterium RV_VA103A]|nr:MAG: 50S ribosomal protein L24 [Mycoplasmataceae bacterium RV_VA103A]